MANKMLIDASHPEETRVVVLRGNRVEEFDFESASKKQLRGNIYLAKVTRVEPSLQAAFVDYGGNRHGFLAFSEIHPDYYQIPVVDRQALIDEEARAQRDEEDDESRAQRRSRRSRRGDRNGNGRRVEKRRDDETLSETFEGEALSQLDAGFEVEAAGSEPARFDADEVNGSLPPEAATAEADGSDESFRENAPAPAAGEASDEPLFGFADEGLAPAPEVEIFASDETLRRESSDAFEDRASPDQASSDAAESRSPDHRHGDADDEGEDDEEQVEQLGGDAMEDVPARPHRYRKQYKIQEVIKRRQVLLVQVVKEERGNKGAALTTYLSLAGRYSVLMPNTARGGGISRKITDSTDRQRLKSIAQELEVPEGMGVILRTAGASRTKAEVKRDFEYLLRMWETVREITLQSTAPTLVYEEGSLIKRSIRDLFNKDIDEILVSGENGYREAKEFMRLLMPSHAKNVQPYRDPQPIFAKSGAEAQLDAMFSNQVTLRSGGYIVINQTEALVAIDVNSGRSTREHNIEDTALRTNLEAVDEIARQLRLRDLAGLIVLDLIDMEEGRNNRAVERRLKDALKNDRARIQVGRISHFGLLEMSRQRIRTGVLEGSTVICPHCAGAGMLRSTSSIALHVLRILEDALIKSASHDIIVKTRTIVALYILNQKRAHLHDLERRFGASVTVAADDGLTGATYYALERGEPAVGSIETPALAPGEPHRGAVQPATDRFFQEADEEIEADLIGSEFAADANEDEDSRHAALDGGEATARERGQDRAIERQDGDGESDADGRRKRRRRRRRGRGSDREGSGIAANAPQPPDDALEAIAMIGGLQHRVSNDAESLFEPALVEAPIASEEEAQIETMPAEIVPVEALADVAEPVNEGQAAATPAAEAPAEEAQIAEGESAAPAERRRPRRGGRAPRAAAQAELSAEPASGATPELALEPETAQKPARSRRTPRPRKSASTAATEAPAAEASAGAEALAAGEPGHQAPDIELAGGEENAPRGTLAKAQTETGASQEDGAPSFSFDSSEPESSQQEPARPKRSGWWQRAKASFRG
jgi:ribonuclease E